MNKTCKVEKKSKDDDATFNTLVYKKYGGNRFTGIAESFHTINSPLVQSLISHEMSSRGWGPVLYGLLDDVRVEEFVDGETLNHFDAFKPDLIDDTAKAFAQFHCLKLPLPKERADVLSQHFVDSLCDKPSLAAWLSTFEADEATINAYKAVLEFPIQEEYNWLRSFRAKISNKFVFSTLDSNYLNRLVRKNVPRDGETTRVLVIDYDGSGYAHRGMDLGGHFANRLFDVSRQETKMSGAPYPSESEKNAFILAYYSHLKEIDHNFDESTDSVQQITLEADLYSCICCCFYILFFHASYKTHHVEPYMYTMCLPLINLYWQLKTSLCKKYPHLVP